MQQTTVTDTAWARQKLPFSTPDLPPSATRASARIIAVWACSQPRTSDQREAGRPGARARRWGSKTITGPRPARAARVTARLSGRVEVVTSAPGASRIIGMTTFMPFPDRGGPSTRTESSTDAQHPTLLAVPSR